MKKLKKTIGVLTLAIMLMCSAAGCETTKLATPGEEKKISSQAEEKKQKKIKKLIINVKKKQKLKMKQNK